MSMPQRGEMMKLKVYFHRWKKEEGYFIKEGRNFESSRSAIAIYKNKGQDITVESRVLFPDDKTKKALEKVYVELEFIVPKKLKKAKE